MVKCDYCGQSAERVTGKEIYPTRFDLHHKTFYRCSPCEAYVGCHPGGDKPLGRLADSQLRKAKQEAHAAFDPRWRGLHGKRREAYRWLAEGLGIDFADCHIGMFDVAMCRRVVKLCNPGRIDMKSGVWITGKDYVESDCQCDVPPWEECECTAPKIEPEQLQHLREIVTE